MTTQHGLQKQHLLAIIAGIIGIVLFWRAIWQLSEKVFSPEWSLMIGIVLLAIVALIERKLFYKFIGAI